MPLSSPVRLYLRSFQHSDAAAFVAAVRESVATVGRWMHWCHAAYSEAEAHDWFDACHRGSADRAAFEFGIFAAETDHLLGGAGLNQLNMQHNLCNLGYWVRESMQRRGIATRTVRALSELGFRELGLTRIEIVVAHGNEASCAVARKAGALFECAARNRVVIGGMPVPASVFSLVPQFPEPRT